MSGAGSGGGGGGRGGKEGKIRSAVAVLRGPGSNPRPSESPQRWSVHTLVSLVHQLGGSHVTAVPRHGNLVPRPSFLCGDLQCMAEAEAQPGFHQWLRWRCLRPPCTLPLPLPSSVIHQAAAAAAAATPTHPLPLDMAPRPPVAAHRHLRAAGACEPWRAAGPPLARAQPHTHMLRPPSHAGPSRLTLTNSISSSSHATRNTLVSCPDQRLVLQTTAQRRDARTYADCMLPPLSHLDLTCRQRYLSIRHFFTTQGQSHTRTPQPASLAVRSRTLYTSAVHCRHAKREGKQQSVEPQDGQDAKSDANAREPPEGRPQPTPPDPRPPASDHHPTPPPPHPPHHQHHFEPYQHPDISSAFANYPKTLRKLALRAISRPPYAPNTPIKPPSPSAPQSHDGSSSGATPGMLPPPPAPETPHGPLVPRRPSKEDLLKYARGFWTRLRIRFKWFTIRGFRRFNADDFSAFFTLGGLGTIILIVIGTTTAVSIVLWGLDMLNMQSECRCAGASHPCRQ